MFFLLVIIDADRYYNIIHLIFLQQNPDVKSFDIYCPSWEFLKDSAKFQSICIALQAAAVGQKGSNADDNNDPESNTESTAVAVTRASRPMGAKKAKRALEEERIIEKVSSAIQGSVSASANNSSASLILTAALDRFTATLIHEWRMDQAYKNADPELKRKYDNLLLMKRMEELDKGSAGVAVGKGGVTAAVDPATQSAMADEANNNEGENGSIKNDDCVKEGMDGNDDVSCSSDSSRTTAAGVNYGNNNKSHAAGNLIGTSVSVAVNGSDDVSSSAGSARTAGNNASSKAQPLVTPAAASAEERRIIGRQHLSNWRYSFLGPWGHGASYDVNESQPIVYEDSYKELLFK